MTKDEVIDLVKTRWYDRSLGTIPREIGTYLANMHVHYYKAIGVYINNNVSLTTLSFHVAWIFAYVWALLRHMEDISEAGIAPGPKLEEYDDLPLTIVDIDWSEMDKDNIIMIVNTYLTDLANEWRFDTFDLWTSDSVNTARYLFETCKQYLLSYGIAEG